MYVCIFLLQYVWAFDKCQHLLGSLSMDMDRSNSNFVSQFKYDIKILTSIHKTSSLKRSLRLFQMVKFGVLMTLEIKAILFDQLTIGKLIREQFFMLIC
jgi:hypothetical protein